MASYPEIIDLRHHQDRTLLNKVYTELYETAFTDPSEVETIEQYATRLWEPQLPPPQPITHFLVAGTNLLDESNRQVDGFLICESYRESLCGLMTFIVTHERARGKGLARKLMSYGRTQLNADMHHWSDQKFGLQALFAEMHNPRQFFGSDVIDPNLRLQIMNKLGANWVPIRYIQPELQPGAPRSHHLLMTAFPTADTNAPIEIPAVVVKNFLFEFYRALGVEQPEQDDDYRSILLDLQAENNVPNMAPELPTVLLTGSI
jgi:GNAT superfamily N-acetyltransferase